MANYPTPAPSFFPFRFSTVAVAATSSSSAMDFGRPHVQSRGATYKSMCARVPSSQLVPPAPAGSDSSQSSSSSVGGTSLSEIHYEQSVQSNKALDDLFDVGHDYSSYLESTISRSDLIIEGALVVIFESFESLSFAYAKRGEVIQNRNGTFHHDDMIGKEFGIKLGSRSTDGYVFCLRPTSELWTRSLPHR